MAVQIPSPEQMREVASRCGLSLSSADAESFRQLFTGHVEAYNAVDAMPDEVPAVRYPRTPRYRPARDENLHNAGYGKTPAKGAPSATGAVHNPHRLGYSAGGSSSGSAVVVALGEADMAMGGDQGGSIRLPASFSGICGMKPTWGLVPYTGIMPIEIFVDHTGPMTA